MSMLLMVKAMQLKVGNPLRKLVLIKLADNANDLGECWPSYQHIADQCEISRSSVKNHIRELEKSGIVTRVFRRNGELNQSNIFRLNLDNPSGAGVDPVGQELTEGGAGDARGGGAGADPRTSHSFEPVNEPTPNPRSGDEVKVTAKAKAQMIVDLYNEACGDQLAKAIALNPKRQRQIENVCKIKLSNGKTPFANYNESAWRKYFELILENKWNTGENPSGWKADIDYAIRPDTVIKTLERKYA